LDSKEIIEKSYEFEVAWNWYFGLFRFNMGVGESCASPPGSDRFYSFFFLQICDPSGVGSGNEHLCL